MTPPTERRPATDATSAPSAASGVDETAPARASAAGTAVAGFGPPAAAGEVGTLGPYRVLKELGKGGMGAVYAAVDTRLDRRLALKVMLPQFAADPPSRERFLREARAAARVKHDHVVTVYEADERNGVPYIAMEYLEGYPLDEFLKRKGNPTPAQVLKIVTEAAAGLAAAHRQGLVHRDVKPGNLWLEAPAGRVKVLDFGLARPVDAEVELTKSGAVVGTPAYMSQEQARGEKVDHRTDLFSLGAVLYRLVTGRLPFQAPNTMAMLIALGTEEPPPVRDLNPSVPVALADLVHQLLSKTPANRPASADEVVQRLRAIAQGRPAAGAAPAASKVVYVPIQVTAVPEANPFADLDATEAESVPAAAPAAGRRKPRPVWPVAAGLAALVLAVFGGVVIVIRNKDGSETKIEVPEGATVTVKGKDGKTLAQVGPGGSGKGVAVTDQPDRKPAELVLSLGGVVWVDAAGERQVSVAAGLPAGPFTLTKLQFKRGVRVTDADLQKLKDCKNLIHLDLEGSAVTDAGLAHFKDCKALTVLRLVGTKVTDVGLAHFRGHEKLTELTAGPDVTDAAPEPFAKCAGLSILGLHGPQITDAVLSRLGNHPRLRALELVNTSVTGAGLVHLKDQTSLTSLDLQGSKVTDAELVHVKPLKVLDRLILWNTPVTDAGLAHLHACRSLTFLNVGTTKVTAKGLADFHAAVPGCRIAHDSGDIEPVDVDRKAAEWVLSAGGTVRVSGQDRDLNAAADLPKERFTLTVINLSRRGVTDAGLAQLKDCTGLTRLYLSNTGVTDAGLTHFKDCKGLQGLYLSGTKVTGAGLVHFKDCKGLEALELADTGLTDAGLAHLKECKGLQGLGLSGTGVTDAGLAHLKGLPLTIVSLSGTAVTDDGLAHLGGCTGIAELRLGATKVTDAGLAHLAALSRLTSLSVDGTRVTGEGFVHLKGCPDVVALNLRESSLTDAGLAHLGNWKKLREVGLDGTAVTDTGLAHLTACQALTHLSVSRAKVSAVGLARFHAAVPGCRIEHDGSVIEPRKDP